MGDSGCLQEVKCQTFGNAARDANWLPLEEH
jgi:hypothetical protein